MAESLIGTKMKAFCANCKGQRNCEIKGHHQETNSDGDMSWWEDWYLLVCCGCDQVFAQSVSSDSESYHPVGYERDGSTIYEHDEVIRRWPSLFKRSRPEWLKTFDSNIEHERASDFTNCLTQVYEALDHDLNILAAIGIRTTFDVAAEILGIEPEQPFARKLDEMERTDLITPTQKEEFEVLINAGSASAHRAWNPKFEDLDPLIATLESFIYDKFVVPHLRKKAAADIAKVKSKVPARATKTKGKGKAAKQNGASSPGVPSP